MFAVILLQTVVLPVDESLEKDNDVARSSQKFKHDVIHVGPSSVVSISYLTHPLAPVLPSSCENARLCAILSALSRHLQRRLDDAQGLQGRAGAALGIGSRV